MRNPEYFVILSIVVASTGLLTFLFIVQESPPKPINDTERGYLALTDEIMICEFNYICFLREGEWHKPAYNAGTNLILANDLEIENEEIIRDFFERDRIIIAINSTPGIVETMPFAYYLSYYYNTFKKKPKEINSTTVSEYNFEEPALVILGPNLELEDKISFKNKNLVVRGKTRESLSLLLGKILLIVVMGK